MKTTGTEKKVLEIVGKISGRKVKKIDPEGNLKNELCLDSIQIVELFAALEKEFQVELPLQMMTAKTGREFMAMLEDTLVENPIYAVKSY
jgi:acyl carrier protein